MTRKVDKFVVHQKFGPLAKFSRYFPNSRIRELECSDSVGNKSLLNFDLLMEEIEEFGEKLGIENGEKH